MGARFDFKMRISGDMQFKLYHKLSCIYNIYVKHLRKDNCVHPNVIVIESKMLILLKLLNCLSFDLKSLYKFCDFYLGIGRNYN